MSEHDANKLLAETVSNKQSAMLMNERKPLNFNIDNIPVLTDIVGDINNPNTWEII